MIFDELSKKRNNRENYDLKQISLEKLKLLFQVLPMSIFSNLIMAFVLVISLWNKVPAKNIIYWIIAIIAVSLSRIVILIMYKIYNFTKSDFNNYRIFYIIFYIQIILSASIWGITGFIFFSYIDNSYRLLTLLLLSGIIIGGTSSLVSDFRLLQTFLLLIFIPITIKLFQFQMIYFSLIGSMIILYYILVTYFAIQLHKVVYGNLIYTQKHRRILEKLKISENKFRMIFESAPIGIFYYNKDYRVYECNEKSYDIMDTKGKLLNFNFEDIKDTRVLDALEAPIKGKTGYYEGEYITTINQKKIWINLTCSPIFDKKNNITGAIGIVQDITDKQLIEEKVRHLAFHDNLTGLPNRILLRDRVEQALTQTNRSNLYGAIFFLDLDNFKNINDTLGHHIGDMILKEIAIRIKTIIRKEDTVARIGGDEFVIVLPKLNTIADTSAIAARKVADKIHKVLNEPFKLFSNSIYSSTSIGIVIFSHEDNNIDDILKYADTAMYEAKKEGRSSTHLYDEKMNTVLNIRLELENNLRNALKNNELHPFFQPIVDASNNYIIGAETLLRWIHPEFGTVSPVDFIPLAEDTNLIIPIGEWLIEQVCININKWNDEFDNPLQYVSINISVNQLRQEDFSEKVSRILHKQNIPPAMIVLEITENVLIGNFDRIANTISTLRKMGIRFALDDFGTGYSSLTYLKKLDIDIIKIDKEFVQDIIANRNDAALIEAILSIADNFNMRVIAEGVEDIGQIELLKTIGCKYFQGYYYSRPVPDKEFDLLLLSFM